MKRKWALAVGMLAVTVVADAGQWLAPAWPAGKQPALRPVPLYWFRVVRSPLVYRKVVNVPSGVDRATALLRTSGYVYVCVDGRQLHAWGAAKDSAERRRIPGQPDRLHELDLSEHLTPGRHVLTISAPAGGGGLGGFVLDGGLYKGAERVAPLASDASWTVTAFRPTTILEDHAVMTLKYGGKAERGVCSAAAKVKAIGEEWTAGEDALAAAHFRAFVQRLDRDLADATWRAELLARKGIYVVGDAAYGWGSPGRPTIAPAVRAAERLLPTARRLAGLTKALGEKPPSTAGELAAMRAQIRALKRRIDAVAGAAKAACDAARASDEARAVELASKVVAAKSPPRPTPADLRRAIASRLGHPLNRLNESRYDRLGWLPHPHLTDSDLGRWGVRVNPPAGATELPLGGRWRFSTDPRDAGLKELRHTIGYNIENQWPWIDGRQSWTRNKQFSRYKGIAWYRSRVSIPAEWAGSEVLLSMRIAGKGRVWVNDAEITDDRAAGGAGFAIPANVAMFGSENTIAVRVVADGATRGLHGAARVACPALDGPAGKATPPVGVLATPLSPCVVLTPRTESLHVRHAGTAELVLPGGKSGSSYAAAADGKLKANWAMLWLTPARASGVERPILLVFQRNPVSIACEAGLTKVTLPAAGVRVIAVRPWAKALPLKAGAEVRAAAALWSRAALAVPINTMSLTRVLEKPLPWQGTTIDSVPAGPVLGQTVIYDYLTTSDEWQTAPLKLAPLPALCSLAIDTKFRNLRIDRRGDLGTVQDGGIAAPYRAIRDTDRVSYRYDVEPWPRFVGFTSWMFSWADTGVPGNEREMELIAATGVNSYRPQNNYSDHRAGGRDRQGRWTGPYPEGEKRTRIRIMADFCRDNGVNFMNNIDQTLGAKREQVRGDYDGWVRTRLFPHYDKLVPQLADRPFWQVAYDLINEPFDHKAAAYNRVTRQLTARIRRIDKRHLLYVEPCQAWGAIQQLRLIQPTGDPLTMYSFHDYNFRMRKADDRWPTLQRDITSICQMWWPAFEFAVRHGAGMHCGEFGGFHRPSDDSLCQKTLLNDLFRIFDQFGMHHHYYTGRGIYQRQLDGSVRPSNVVRTYRKYTRREDLNLYYALWAEHPAPGGR